MGILDVTFKNGKMKSGKAIAKAVHWLDIQEQMKELTWEEFKEIVFPVIEHFQEQ